MTAISVIVPVFNRARMIQEALASVVGQSRPADEIIVVDDGSEDDSAEAAGAFPGVRVIRQPNRGISAARNRGILAASGSHLSFLDSDDLWHRDKLRRQDRFMRAHPEVPLCHTDEEWIRCGRRVNPRAYHRKEGGFIFLRSLERCLISPSAVMIRKDLLSIVGLFDEALPVCEDYDLWLRITAGYPVGFIAEPLTIKRGGHDDQLSKKMPAMDRYRLKALEKMLRQNKLCADYRERTLAVYLEKAAILLAGMRKRGRTFEASELIQRVNAVRKETTRLARNRFE